MPINFSSIKTSSTYGALPLYRLILFCQYPAPTGQNKNYNLG